MPSFGHRSEKKLSQLDPRLVRILRIAIKYIDFTILCTKRNKTEQEEAYATGASKVRWPDSKHNCAVQVPGIPKQAWPEDIDALSEAVDVAPWFKQAPHIRWDDKDSFIYLQGILKGIALVEGVSVRSGLDWDSDGLLNWRDPDGSKFNDLPHLELSVD